MLPIPAAVRAADRDGFVSLFNGRDLRGWVNANCAPETSRRMRKLMSEISSSSPEPMTHIPQPRTCEKSTMWARTSLGVQSLASWAVCSGRGRTAMNVTNSSSRPSEASSRSTTVRPSTGRASS